MQHAELYRDGVLPGRTKTGTLETGADFLSLISYVRKANSFSFLCLSSLVFAASLHSSSWLDFDLLTGISQQHPTILHLCSS
jgi:hypothetical protein